MSEIQDILDQLPVDQLAQQVGASPAEVTSAAQAIVPSLVGGMQANAQDPGGAQSLLNALGQHQDGAPSPDTIDPAEGQQIVQHIFGSNTDQVVNQLGGLGGGSAGSDLVRKLLPILAPIVISYISSRVLGRQGGGPATPAPQQPAPTQQQQPAPSGGPVTGSDQGGPVTGGAQGGPVTGGAQGGGGLGDILGQVLGGGAAGGAAGSGLPGGLGDILGGLLGGGRKA